MIREHKIHMRVPHEKAKKLAAYKKGKHKDGVLSFTAKHAKGKAWRLVHNGSKAIALIDGTDNCETTTIHELEEFATKEDALNRIKELNLEPLPEDELAALGETPTPTPEPHPGPHKK